MYYDKQTDRIYDDGSAMEGIFGRMINAGKDSIKSDIRDVKHSFSALKGKTKKKNNGKHNQPIKATPEEIEKQSKLNEETKKKYNCETKDKMITLVLKFLKDEIWVIKSNKELMGKIRTFCKENKYSAPSFNVYFDDDEEWFEIIDSEQDVRIEFGDIVYDLADKLKSKYGDLIHAFGYSLGTGDGDEGCIYLE